MVPGPFSWFFMVQGWFFMVFIQNVPARTESWPNYPVRRPEGSKGPSYHKDPNGTMKNNKNTPGPKNQPGTLKNHKNQTGTMENQSGIVKTMKTNLELHGWFQEEVISFCYKQTNTSS